MKCSVLGFNQEKIVNKFPDINIADLLLLDYIWQAQAQPSMQHIIDNDVVYVWLSHSKILEDLPVLNIKEEMLKKKIKHLINISLIQSKIVASEKNRGTKSYYAITSECESLKFNNEDMTKCKKLHENTSSGVKNSTCSSRPSVKNYTSDNKLIRNDNKLEKEDISKDISKKKEFSLNHSYQEQELKSVDNVIDLYFTICVNLPKIKVVTDNRKRTIRNLLKKYSLNQIKEMFELANDSTFLTGDNDRGWKASFDWLIDESNFVKVYEGKYNSKAKKKVNKFGETEHERCGREREVKELHVIKEY